MRGEAKPRTSRGFTVLELLVGLLLTVLLLHGAWSVLAVQRGAVRAVVRRAETLEAVQTMHWLLGQEVGGGLSGPDWQAGADTLALRAFRAIAVADSLPAADGSVRLCVHGLRQPEPEKDSVLLLLRDGRWQPHDLRERVPIAGTCGGGALAGRLERWILDPIPSPVIMARVFERGSYHLTGGALRYRRGEGGRQPVTAEVMEEGGFTPEWDRSGPLEWWISLEPPPLRSSLPLQVGEGGESAPAWRWRGSLRGGAW